MIQIIPIRNHPELAERAAEWFNQKWRTPLEAYKESIADCLSQMNAVPQWYLAMEGNVISGGLGVIENDFHNRRDLAPNVCAVFVEEHFRCQGIAGKMLDGNSYAWYRGRRTGTFKNVHPYPGITGQRETPVSRRISILKRQCHLFCPVGSAILADDIIHTIENLSVPALFCKKFPKFPGLRADTLVVVSIPLLIGFRKPFPREQFVQFLVIPCSLIPPQSHAKGRIDKSGPCVPGHTDNLPNIFLIIFDKRQDRHEQDPCIQSCLRKLLYETEPL